MRCVCVGGCVGVGGVGVGVGGGGVWVRVWWAGVMGGCGGWGWG